MPVLVIQFSSDKTSSFLVAYKILFAGAEETKTPSEQTKDTFYVHGQLVLRQGTA